VAFHLCLLPGQKVSGHDHQYGCVSRLVKVAEHASGGSEKL
jgi:hypothetical protein